MSEIEMMMRHARSTWAISMGIAACSGSDPSGTWGAMEPAAGAESGGSESTAGQGAGGDASSGGSGGSAGDPSGTESGEPSTAEGGSSSSPQSESSADETSAGGPADATGEDSSTDSGDPERCAADGPIGWASENGGTVGGAGGPTTPVDAADELIALAAANGPQIIIVQGDITLDERLEIASDKTIEGAPGGATIHGSVVMYGDDDAPVENVILRNLFIDGENGAIDDAVSMQWAINVWIDHCDIYDGADGNLDITHGSDFVTVSWTRFHYTDAAPDPDHRFSNLIGHSDNNASEDEDALRVTLHHDWWTEGVVERMPRVRFGQVHVFNNLFDSADTNYAIRAAIGSEVLVESNYFDGTPNPHEIFDEGAEMVAIDNVYAGTSGAQDVAGDAFEPPYAYEADEADDIPTRVPTCVGPR